MWKRSFHSPLEFIAFTFWFPVLKNPASNFLQSLILFVTPQTKLQIFQALESLIIFAVISIASLSFVTDSAIAVPVVPNESFVTEVVSEYGIVSSRLLSIQPDQKIYKLTIFIESLDDIAGMPNLLKGKEGQDITVYTKELQSSDIFGKK